MPWIHNTSDVTPVECTIHATKGWFRHATARVFCASFGLIFHGCEGIGEEHGGKECDWESTI
jgi:hypothetical protein